MTNKGTAGSPRTEAQPFPWNDLSGDQKRAAEGILEILAEIAKHATASEGDRARAAAAKPLFDFMPHVDRDRKSHVLLIDGGRGTGKSVVLLTLLSAWSRRARKEELSADLAERLEPTDMVIPVGLVDLEALPEETNLRLHLVGQLQRVMQAVEADDGAHGERRDNRGAWEMPFSESPVKRAWRDFLRATTLGGAAGLLERRAHVDPETFVVEMEETEIDRMDIQRSFRALVDTLATHFMKQRLLPEGKSPVFLFAVDDADMKPKLSMPLLQLVRELWHPRVVFLMTGDSYLFTESLRVEVRLARREAPAEPARLVELEGILALEDQLIDQRYRKVIPPGQRYLLPQLRPADRLKHLRGDLEGVPAPRHPLKLQHFAEYLELVEQARGILPSNFRELHDLRQWIGAPGTEGQDHDSVTATTKRARHRELTRRSAQEVIWALTLHPKNYAAEIVHRNNRIAIALDARVDKLMISPAKRWAPKDGYKPVSVAEPDTSRSVQFGTFLHGELELSRADRKGSWYGESTSFLVALDAVRHEHGDRDDAIHEAMPSLPAIVQTQQGERAYGWPFPDWRSPLDVIVFWQFFQFVLEPASRKDLSVEDLAKSYLLAVLEHIELRVQRKLTSNPGPLHDALKALAKRVQDAQPSWADLASRVQKHADSQTTSSTPVKEWALGGAGLLAAPEIRLGATIANAWLKAIKTAFPAPLWTEARQELRTARELLRNEAQRGIPDGNAVDMSPDGDPDVDLDFDLGVDEDSDVEDTETPGYEWDQLIADERVLDRAQTWERFSKVASSLPVREVEPHEGPLPASLGRYIQAARRTYLERDASPELLNDWVRTAGVLGKSHGATVQAVRELWAIIARDEASGMPKSPPDLTVAELMRLYEGFNGGAEVWRFVRETGEVSLLHSTMVRRGSFRWAEGVKLRDPLARIVFEIALDYAVDTEDLSLQDSRATPDPRLQWWMGGGGGFEGALCPWPAVDWWSFLDHILLCGAWNRRVNSVEQLNERLSTPTRIGDDVALWYVRAVHQLAETRSARDTAANRWQQGADKTDWLEQIQRMRTHAPLHNESARWRCYREWLTRLPLLAAPESGLSPEAAGWILEAFSLNDGQKAQLQEHRILRLTQGMGQDPDQAEDTLAQIDRDAKDHPWAKLFEQPV